MIKPFIIEEWKDVNLLDIKRNLYLISNCGEILNKNTNKKLSDVYCNGYRCVQHVKPVCILLSEGKSIIEILDKLNLPNIEVNRRFIYRVKNRKAYLDISKNYNW